MNGTKEYYQNLTELTLRCQKILKMNSHRQSKIFHRHFLFEPQN